MYCLKKLTTPSPTAEDSILANFQLLIDLLPQHRTEGLALVSAVEGVLKLLPCGIGSYIIRYDEIMHGLARLVFCTLEIGVFSYAASSTENDGLLLRSVKVGAYLASLYMLVQQLISLVAQKVCISQFGKEHFLNWLTVTLKQCATISLVPAAFFCSTAITLQPNPDTKNPNPLEVTVFAALVATMIITVKETVIHGLSVAVKRPQLNYNILRQTHDANANDSILSMDTSDNADERLTIYATKINKMLSKYDNFGIYFLWNLVFMIVLRTNIPGVNNFLDVHLPAIENPTTNTVIQNLILSSIDVFLSILLCNLAALLGRLKRVIAGSFGLKIAYDPDQFRKELKEATDVSKSEA